MTEWNTEIIRDLVLEAGRIALASFDDPQTIHKPDRSLVTVADHAIEDFLTDELVAAGDAMLLGEETVGTAGADTITDATRGVTWVVDPIDGTSSYANRLPTWGVSLARLEDGRFTDGALFLPETGDLFITDRSEVLHRRGSRDPARWQFNTLNTLHVPERPYNSMGMVSLPHEIAYGGRFDGANPLQAAGSAVYSLAQVVLGGYIAYVARIRLWDIAASIPILQRLGFLIQFPDGRNLGETITATDWNLDPAELGIWRSAAVLFIARNQDTIDYVRRNYHPAAGQ